MLARKASSESKGPTVQIGKLAIEVAGGNIAAWAASEVPDALEVTSQKGQHSAELERMSKDRTRISRSRSRSRRRTSPGRSSTWGRSPSRFTNGRIKGYAGRRRHGVVAGWRLRRRSPDEDTHTVA